MLKIHGLFKSYQKHLLFIELMLLIFIFLILGIQTTTVLRMCVRDFGQERRAAPSMFLVVWACFHCQAVIGLWCRTSSVCCQIVIESVERDDGDIIQSMFFWHLAEDGPGSAAQRCFLDCYFAEPRTRSTAQHRLCFNCVLLCFIMY